MFRATALTLALLPLTASADPLRIVTDLPPVGAMLRAIAGPEAEVTQLVGPGEDAHHFQLRPSQARALNDADVVVWLGEAMTPWLEGPLETLGENGTTIELLDLPGTHLRESSEEDHETEAHDDHEDEAHDEQPEEGHDHGPIDPHAWLAPENAAVWATEIATALSAANPDQAEFYAANAADLGASIDAAITEASTLLSDLPTGAILPYHDAFGYFFDRFGLSALPPLVDETGSAPGAARLSEVMEAAQSGTLRCVLATPEADAAQIERLIGDLPVNVAQFDPLGGANSGDFAAIYVDLARTIADCMGG